jgi:prevent-host-death family protein
MTTLKIDRKSMVSSSELVRNLSKLLDETKKGPLFVMKNNEIENIIMSIDHYEELMEKIEYLENYLEDQMMQKEIMERKETFNPETAVSETEIEDLLNE